MIEGNMISKRWIEVLGLISGITGFATADKSVVTFQTKDNFVTDWNGMLMEIKEDSNGRNTIR
jgi:hypothetical protein